MIIGRVESLEGFKGGGGGAGEVGGISTSRGAAELTATNESEHIVGKAARGTRLMEAMNSGRQIEEAVPTTSEEAEATISEGSIR